MNTLMEILSLLPTSLETPATMGLHLFKDGSACPRCGLVHFDFQEKRFK